MSRSNSTLLMLVFTGAIAGLCPSISAAQVPSTPVQRLASAPVAADPHEPVTGAIRIASSPVERGDALAMLERARQHALTHRGGFPPYRLEANFSAGGAAAHTGQGQFVETWVSGQKWLWTASLGNYSVSRSVGFGTASDAGAVPMRIHMLRNAIFWAERPIADRQIRTASIERNGRPATCILVSRMPNPAEATRLWEESEYCIDNASGVLQVESAAPGTYSVYSYDKGLRFHGQAAPDRIRIFVNGAQALDAQLSLADAGSVDETMLRPTADMIAAGPVASLEMWTRLAINVPSASVSGLARPVIVHASVDGAGRVVEQELSSASDPALVQAAFDTVKSTRLSATGTQGQIYINVRFVPASR